LVLAYLKTYINQKILNKNFYFKLQIQKNEWLLANLNELAFNLHYGGGKAERFKVPRQKY
jgi:hypothetical protein